MNMTLSFLAHGATGWLAILAYRAWRNWQNLTAALVIFVAAFLIVCLGTLPARAEGLPDVQIMMGRVEAVLTMHGYPQAKGYAKLAPPATVMVDNLPGGAWGAYEPGLIKISRTQPDACVPVTLSHELTHDVTVRMRLLDAELTGVPAYVLKAEMERIAAKVESFVGSDGTWLPNCLMRRAHP